MSDARLGSRVGDYVLERALGKGGMSRVYFARERHTGRGVAIKILQAGLPTNMAADRRLEQEARAITRIDHENVVEVYGWGRTPDGLPYIAMEYLEGRTLAHLVSIGRAVTVERLLPIAGQILSALARAHLLDIIHRDLKPDNVFLIRRDGQEDFVKMLDFGIAKLLGAQPHSLVQTVQGLVLGTPEYLPPELALGNEVSPATDIYALGVILFEGLTGRLPFVGESAGELAEQHCFNPPPRLRSLAPDVPAGLEAVVLRCLAKDPAMRYPSADALAQALHPFMARTSGVATVASAPIGTPERSPAADNAAVERSLRDAVSRRWFDAEVLPPPLAQELAALDDLRQRIDALGTELALIDDALAEVVGGLAGEELAVQDALQHEATLTEELRLLARQDAEEAKALEALDCGRAVLERLALGGGRAPTNELQSVLSADRIDALERQIGGADEAAQRTARRRRLQAQYTDVVQRLGRVGADRAEREARLTQERARRAATQRQLEARRLGLTIDLADLESAQGRALAHLALVLAVALGHR